MSYIMSDVSRLDGLHGTPCERAVRVHDEAVLIVELTKSARVRNRGHNSLDYSTVAKCLAIVEEQLSYNLIL